MILRMEREWVAEESIIISAEPESVFAAVAEPRRMTGWSPELFAVWMPGGRGPARPGTRFVGFNRRGWWVWFTTARVSAVVPGEVFAFRVSSFGMPVALWGYRLEAIGPGATRLTEYWEDLRRDNRGARLVSLLGLVFTGVRPARRSAVNRAGMRTTLSRIKTAVE
jgi:uncharacterized protein YndB with AHSA1/START domain